jgi:hypothetical protein
LTCRFWTVQRSAGGRRRTWRKLHLAVDAATNTIAAAATLTTSGEGAAG